MTGKKRFMEAGKRRDENRENIATVDFQLTDERLIAAEEALGKSAQNEALRNELISKFDEYKILVQLWHPLYRQATTVSALQKEAENVLTRLRDGGDLFSILNSNPFKKPNDNDVTEHNRRITERHENTLRRRLLGDDSDGPTKSERETDTPAKHEIAKRRKRKAVKLNARISGELLSHLLHHGVVPEMPELEAVKRAIGELLEMPRDKPGRPKEYSRDWFLRALAAIFERETGMAASSSKGWRRGQGRFMDLCRAMLIPTDDFQYEEAEAIGKTFERIGGGGS